MGNLFEYYYWFHTFIHLLVHEVTHKTPYLYINAYCPTIKDDPNLSSFEHDRNVEYEAKERDQEAIKNVAKKRSWKCIRGKDFWLNLLANHPSISESETENLLCEIGQIYCVSHTSLSE